jgi:hypothetical protein
VSNWPKDNQEALIAFYGDPAKGQPAAQLVAVTPPFRMTYEGTTVPHIMFHRKAADALAAALATIWDYYGRDQATIDRLHVSRFDGAFNPRYIRGSTTKWSNHAYGAAIDIDADENPMGSGHGHIPLPVIAAFKAQGARWGGDYSGRTDPMHFEFCDSGEPSRTFEEWLAHYGVTTQAAPSAAQALSPPPSPAADRFAACLPWILKMEGGNDDDPYDHGGRTSRGVIQREYDRYRAEKGLPTRDVWSASDSEIADIYEHKYWLPIAPTLPAGVDLMYFDTGVNAGPGQGAKQLQRALGVAPDGAIGPATLSAVRSADAAQLIKAFADQRRSFYRSLPQYPRYGRGWLSRVDQIEAAALEMVA